MMKSFAKADVEEVEDNLVKQYRRSHRPLKQADISRISNKINVTDLDTGVLRSVTGLRKSQVRQSIKKQIESSSDEDESEQSHVSMWKDEDDGSQPVEKKTRNKTGTFGNREDHGNAAQSRPSNVSAASLAESVPDFVLDDPDPDN